MTPLPQFIGPRNAEAQTGLPWRWCRDHARTWGLPILRVDGKSVIEARAFFEALRAHAIVEEPEPVSELEAMRTAIGKRRIA